MTDTPPEEKTLDLTWDESELSPMEREFCRHALELIGNGERYWRKAAAERAGYKEPRGAACELIRRPRVINYMAKRMTEATEAVHVDQTFVLFRAMTNLAICEAREDYRTAHRYLDLIARHLRGLTDDRGKDGGGQPGMMSLPFDMSKLETNDIAALAAILRKAGGGPVPTA